MAEDENPDYGQYHELRQVQDVREKGAKSTVVFHCGDGANGSDSCGPVGPGNNDGSAYSTGSAESFGNNRPLLSSHTSL